MCYSLPLAGRKAFITGGTRGIGAAVATRLREDGATVLITARVRPDDLRAQDLFVAADITSAKGCAVIAEAVSDQLGTSSSMLSAVCTENFVRVDDVAKSPKLAE
jgi:NAD(P)-dependent dehydrogenase (short-subunit alcohol dehydrogenase family)